ncbi:choice-of-anchor H family protein [Shewanella youngdeokensis]|uniref:Choice-of-anchor H family protein n=1 Tax=Shewanella youngdeokensis TaxID=2999068 RepID=A0ABZ0K0J3_9GAMM|nr:choice-of-anchor H family protein [Shewanella sp. DAU334]
MKLTKSMMKWITHALWFCIALLPMALMAKDIPVSSVSAGYKQSDDSERQFRLNSELSTTQKQLIDNRQPVQPSASKQTREVVIQAHIDSANKKVRQQQAQASASVFANPIYHQFQIYDAYTRLFVDNDADGFYQTFSVTFDADVSGQYVNESANVFAELYLSRNGGPWLHYYTTDVFSIYGDASDDDFEVLTTLEAGYATGHYDVLIDLYELGYGDIVATVSANELDSLYALPLESANRDGSEIEYGDPVAGSLSLWLLLGLLLVFLGRKQ